MPSLNKTDANGGCPQGMVDVREHLDLEAILWVAAEQAVTAL